MDQWALYQIDWLLCRMEGKGTNYIGETARTLWDSQGEASGQAEEEVARECLPLPPGAGTSSEGPRVCNQVGKERPKPVWANQVAT